MSYIKGVDKIIDNLQRIKKSSKNINYLFIDKSLNWIKTQANKNLDARTNGYDSSNAREWTKKIYQNKGTLENNDMNSASIEFGIGRVGATRSLSNVVALENSYEYDRPSQYKDDNGYWTFMDNNTGIYITTRGYIGKSFLYDAFAEYMMNKHWVELYNEAFDEIMRGIVK